MDISDALAADLVLLNVAVDDTGEAAEDSLHQAVRDLRLAVRSYVGLTTHIVVQGFPVALTVIEDYADEDDICSSLLVPMSAICTAEPDSAIVFYASRAGAFVDLAADLSYALGIDLDVLRVDENLRPPTGMSTVTDFADVNRAIGVLIEQGHQPGQARAELQRLATVGAITVHAAARDTVRKVIDRVA